MADQRKINTCFVSYSWDSSAHRQWVLRLATCLTANGVLVRLDEWEVLLGNDITEFMESGIRESDYVLIICTPAYALKANARRGGTGYETSVISGELFQLFPNHDKYIPILREGMPATTLPSYLKSALFIDFRKDSDFQSKMEDLLRHIYRCPRHPRPTLGPSPFFTSHQTSDNATPLQIARECRPSQELDRRIADLQKQLQELHGAHVPTYITGGRFINFDVDEAIARVTAQLAELQGRRKRMHSDQPSELFSADCVDLNPLSRKRTAENKTQEREDTLCYRCGNYTMYGARCDTCGAFRD